jgi:hypothetical protein
LATPDAERLAELFHEYQQDIFGTRYPWANISKRRHQSFLGAMSTLVDQGWIIPADPDEGHLIKFDDDGWTIQHPPRCRRDGHLFDCPVNAAAHRSRWSWDSHPHGVYTLDLDDDGELVVAQVPEVPEVPPVPDDAGEGRD